jgi:hypothetical protein
MPPDSLIERAIVINGENRADLPEKKADWHRNCACSYLAGEPRHERLRGQAGGTATLYPNT